MPNPLITLRVDANIYKQLEKYAKLLDRTKTWIIRKSIENYFEELKDLEIAMERLNDPNSEYVSLEDAKKELGLGKH